MKKKFLLLYVTALLITQSVTAQITLNLALNSRPQPWLSDWVNPVNGQLIITYSAGPVLNDPLVKLRTTISDQNGSVIGVSNTNAARVYTLKPGVNQFTMADALQLPNLILNESVQRRLQSSGRLAAGQYQLTVEVTNAAGDIVRARQTRPFFITSFQLPVLINPADGSKLDAAIAQSAIIFRWTRLVPASPDIPRYLVQVFEVLPGQTPMQAFRGNRPLLNEQAVPGTTQFIWRPNLPMLDSTANRQFIWTIQTLDFRGIPVPTPDINLQGRSEPAIFSIVHQKKATDKNLKHEDK